MLGTVLRVLYAMFSIIFKMTTQGRYYYYLPLTGIKTESKIDNNLTKATQMLSI